MRLPRRLLSVLCVCLFSLIAFSGMCLDASADSLIVQLDSITTRYLLGDTINGGYVDNEGNYKSCVFEFSDYMTMGDSNLKTQGRYSSGAMLMHYKAAVNNDIGQVLTNFQPICYVDLGVSLENVTYFEWLSGAWINGVWTTTNLTTLNSFAYFDSTAPALPTSSVGIGDGRYRTNFQNNKYSSSKGGLFQVNGSDKAFSGCYYLVQASTGGDLFLDTLQFCCCSYSGGYLEIVFTCPYVNADFIIPSAGSEIPPFSGDGASSGSVSGTISDNGDGSQDIHITVETDNTGLIGGILSGIKNLFIPSQEFMNGWHQDIEDSFEEHLGGVSQAVSLIDEQADYLRAATSAQYIYFPELTLPIGDSGGTASRPLIGADYTLIAGHQVELRPARQGNLKVLWDFVEFAVDAVCVIAVINMLQTKYEIFLNPDGEVISYDR